MDQTKETSSQDYENWQPSEESPGLPEGYDIPEGEFAVFGKVYTDPDHSDEVAEIYRQTTKRAMSDAEPGTIYYCLCRDPKDSSIFHFYERYVSKHAFRYHNDQAVIKKLISSGWMKDVEAVFATPVDL